ncbi:glycoside hydrolase family 5 protein [Hydnum rufescens UP504]|uniref:glucan 1,3-beta-glucosidase n=1 Tax=Hydnum rufescens UP504 TaxID=1448309 RepID=A0A9P6AWI9_9AGAM|nr:glycoside hydrolase family 5 protein [Hydnum rufescens UP504]
MTPVRLRAARRRLFWFTYRHAVHWCSGSPTSNVIITGGDGSTLLLDSGATMTYTNKLGGYWYYDQNDPFNGAARAQSYTPPLNQSWQYGVDRIFGVNLGGWFNTEPFISPGLYEAYVNATTPAVDEWTLSVNMAADTANGGLNQLEKHYATFITEEDFAMIAGAGLNWVRIPFPYWGVAKFPGEPFLEGVAWKYFLKAIAWARKYGIRINLDLHAVPGSQNAQVFGRLFNHSGKMGTINWLYGVMGIANAQRTLDTIRVIAEFISQPQYSDVVVMFGLINEPQVGILGQDIIGHFYYQAYNIIRNITGIGNGPFISIHDGFLPDQRYTGFLSGADRIALDTHPYLCFQTLNTDGPAAQALRPCPAWGANINNTMANFGMMTAGEWSLGYTDCGLFLNGVGEGTRYEGTLTTFPSNKLGNCADVLDWPNWTATYKQGLQLFAEASSDALQNAFFWTWKIGNSSVTGRVESPHWSYRLGLEQGWMPLDPRSASGTCASQGVNSPFNGPLQSWQTGGSGAGTITPSQISLYQAWPPASLSASGGPINDAAVLPTYTPTGSLTTLPPPTLTMRSSSATINAGNGWQDPSDTASAYTPIAGCSYPDGWNAGAAATPTAACTGARRKRGEHARDLIPKAVITARP